MKKEDYLQILQENLKSSTRRLTVLFSLGIQRGQCSETHIKISKRLNQSRIMVLFVPGTSQIQLSDFI